MVEKTDPEEKYYLGLVREFIYKKTGIHIKENRDYALKARLQKFIQSHQYTSMRDLYHSVTNSDEAYYWFVHYITTPHTYFFRERQHLDILRKDILIRKVEYPLIWCAASSTGEETYSIAIELIEHGINNFLIVASDINARALVHLKRGVYGKLKLDQTPREILKKYFQISVDKKTNFYRVKDFIRKHIIVKKLNLVEPIHFERQFNYIFARNVLIYFDHETQNRVVDSLLLNLDDLGYLFIGHTESLIHLRDDVESVFTSVYNKKPKGVFGGK